MNSRARSRRPPAESTCWLTLRPPFGDTAGTAQPISRPVPLHHRIGHLRHSSSRTRPLDTSMFPWSTRARTRSTGTLPISSRLFSIWIRPVRMNARAPGVARRAEGGAAVKLTIALLLILFTWIVAAADIPSAQVQIAGAVLAAPAELREGAAVLGYDAQGGRVWIREGKNELVCLATDPTKTAFNVACYHKDLEPFMARGRELLAQKVTGAKRNEIRFKEVEEGKLPMPREPRTLYVLTGTSFDGASGKVQDPYLRWVIYVPFATTQSTGLSTKASEGAPWLMNPGTAGAHIMINPPKK